MVLSLFSGSPGWLCLCYRERLVLVLVRPCCGGAFVRTLLCLDGTSLVPVHRGVVTPARCGTFDRAVGSFDGHRGGGQLRRLLQGVKFYWFEGTGDDFPDAEEIAEGVQRPSDQVRPPTFVPDTTAWQNINTLRQAPPGLTKWKLQIARANLLG